jgi:hypothetical protein
VHHGGFITLTHQLLYTDNNSTWLCSSVHCYISLNLTVRFKWAVSVFIHVPVSRNALGMQCFEVRTNGKGNAVSLHAMKSGEEWWVVSFKPWPPYPGREPGIHRTGQVYTEQDRYAHKPVSYILQKTKISCTWWGSNLELSGPQSTHCINWATLALVFLWC